MTSIVDQLQRPLQDLRISVIDRCNFRCPYCMPAEQFHHSYQFLEKEQWLTFDEIERVVKVFVDLGVQKVRLTGGEPLLGPGIEQLIGKLSAIPGIKDLAMTTNGSLLTDYAVKLKKAGLKRLTVSLDSLDPHIFKTLSGFKGEVQKVLAGIKAAQSAGFEDVKINAVIQKGLNDEAMIDLVRFARQEGHTLRFIEYMDVGNQNHWDLTQVVSSQEIMERINAFYPLEPLGGTEDGETSERYRFIDGGGEIGFISSVSHPFCGTCNRLRLSAEGRMYTCLFAGQGADLRQPLRSGAQDDGLEELIREVWQKRQDRYSQRRSQIHPQQRLLTKIEMYQIGG
jgi:cyclic pyranopterin phosphate synthase